MQNTKTAEIENKIPDITNLATKTNLNTRQAEVDWIQLSDVNNLVTKDIVNTKTTEIQSKTPDTQAFITTPDFNWLTTINFEAKMKEETSCLSGKFQIDNDLEIADKSREMIKKLQLSSWSCFNGRRFLNNNGSQNYLQFQSAKWQ